MEEYIIKNIMKNNPSMSHEDAEKEANRIQKAYNKANKERDIKRQEEHKRKWEESLQSDNDMFALNNLSDEELDDYFNQWQSCHKKEKFMSSTDQFLTKTRFKIGLECPTKLYYLSKAYSSSKNENEFLQVHADGGHQVGEYAKFVIKAKYPNHHFEDLSSDLNYPSCVDRTDDFLKQDKIIINH